MGKSKELDQEKLQEEKDKLKKEIKVIKENKAKKDVEKSEIEEKPVVKEEKTEEQREQEENDKVKDIVKKAKETGKMTYGELAKELEDTNPEQIDKVFDAFEEMGVSLLNDDFEEEPDIDDLK